MVNVPSDSPLEKASFFLCKCLSIADISLIGSRDRCPLTPYTCLDWSYVDLRSDSIVAVNSCMYQSCWVWKTLFYWSHSFLPTLTIPWTPLLHRSLTPKGRGLKKTSHFGLSSPTSYSLLIAWLRIYVLFPISCKRLLNDDWRGSLSKKEKLWNFQINVYNLKNIIPIEVTQTYKTKYRMF